MCSMILQSAIREYVLEKHPLWNILNTRDNLITIANVKDHNTCIHVCFDSYMISYFTSAGCRGMYHINHKPFNENDIFDCIDIVVSCVENDINLEQVPHMHQLSKVISGGQDGVDFIGVSIAKLYGIATGGTMPKGFETIFGPNPGRAGEFGMVESDFHGYPPRTYANVEEADGTLRIATNFQSSGEVCTLKAIRKYNKPYFDINPIENWDVASLVRWFSDNNIRILNVAGNSPKSDYYIDRRAPQVLHKVFQAIGYTIGN